MTFNDEFIIYPTESGWRALRHFYLSRYPDSKKEVVDKFIETHKYNGGFKEQLHVLMQDYQWMLPAHLENLKIDPA